MESQDWITNEVIIVEEKDIEKLAVDKFSFLEKEMGLSKPKIKRERWKTRISYLGKDTGFDIELDWREFEVIVLVVRLENGKLPEGYYISQGKKSRLMIDQILKNRFHESLNGMNKINKFMKEGKQRSFDIMVKQIEEYNTLMLIYSNVILSYGTKIFEN